MGLARRIKYFMDKVNLFIVKFSILLAFAFGLVILHEPERAHAVTTLTMGDGTVYFDDSNNYYTALCNALDVAVERGLCPSNFSYRYLLQQYPLLEYIDGDNPDILIDVWKTSDNRVMLSISRHTQLNGIEYLANTNKYRFDSSLRLVESDGTSYFGLSSYRLLNHSAVTIVGRLLPDNVGVGLKQAVVLSDNLDTYLDYLFDDSMSSTFNCFNLCLTNDNSTLYSVGNSTYQFQNEYTNYFTPVVLSNVYYKCVGSSFLRRDFPYADVYLYLYGNVEDIQFEAWNPIAYSVIGESLTPDVVIPLLTPSPVPTMPYNQSTPTPMVVDTGIFGFGNTDVNASSDYQNVLTAWIDGVNKLDNIIFLRVLADTILTSNMFSWILIPVAFALIAWVWGLKPFSHKDGDDND